MAEVKDSQSLKNVRIWLSAAFLDTAGCEKNDQITNFVRSLAEVVFENGGCIIHGFQPQITPILCGVASKYIRSEVCGDRLILYVSRFFSDNSETQKQIAEYRKCSRIYETACINGSREESLELMRNMMLESSNAFVAIGGKLHKDNGLRPGVPVEIEKAISKGLPMFLLGRFGGGTQEYIERNRAVIESLSRNGLSEEENESVLDGQDVIHLTDLILRGLKRIPFPRICSIERNVPFRILSLDGGGIKGAFSAAVIAKFEDLCGCRIVEYFDLIAGTSTGSIIALGLAAGLSGSEILKLYREKGVVIFPQSRFAAIKSIFRAKYSAKGLESCLSEVLRNGADQYCLNDARTRVLIPTVDAIDGKSVLLMSPHVERCKGMEDMSMIDAAMASSAAPVFFNAREVKSSFGGTTSYIDGGVFANNPSLEAYLHAKYELHIPDEDIEILNIGTTSSANNYFGQISSGLFGWLMGKRIFKLLMGSPEDATNRLMPVIMGDRFVRLDCPVREDAFSLDGVRFTDQLIHLGEKTATEDANLRRIKDRFLNGVKASPWK